MARSRKIGLITGPVTKGATPWGRLPDYVKQRLNMHNPWADGRTQDDARLQRLYEGYFTVRRPEDEMLEIWVSSPRPALRNGISFLGPVTYEGDPNPGRIDERMLVILARVDRDRELSAGAWKAETEALLARIQTNEDDQRRIEEAVMRDRFQSLISDRKFVARKVRPISPVAVAANLTH